MPKKSASTKLIYNDFEKLFKADLAKKQKRISKSVELDFEKLLKKEKAYEKTEGNRARKAVTKSKSKSKLITTKKIKKKVSIPKQDLNYEAFQKSFMLPTPLKMTKKMMSGLNFTEFLHSNFYTLLKDFFIDSKNFTKNKYTLATVGYHFFFFGQDKTKTYQSGFRKPRIHLTENNIDKVLNELLMQTFERFDVYFKTKGKSALFFEGMTAEVSFDTKGKKK